MTDSFPIALQLYSIREDIEKDFEGSLRKVKKLGYEGVEFAGLYGHKPSEIKVLLKEIDLVPVSAHVPLAEMLSAPERVVEDYAEIGCRYIAIPYLMPEYRPDGSKFNEVIEGAKTLGKAAKVHGMTLLYHNHDFEFKKLGGEYALDILYKSVSSDLLETELDTCWVKVAGEDPSYYVRKYSGRAPVVHLKDFFRAGENNGKMYKLIGIDDDKREEGKSTFEFRPLGYGMQKFSEILDACKAAGTSWVVVEQDSPSMNKTSFECAEMSIKYLKSI